MCGIVGIASRTCVVERSWLAAGSDAMRHRGPDGHGEWWSEDGCVGLGHRRLAVIDLSPAGAQPMSDGSGALHITFNGEIYNFIDLRRQLAGLGHVFRTASDTEVVLAAYREWGGACLERLNGMFAFALYDATRRQLFMARDRAGEKPLYYALTSESLRFASELKGLMADPRLPREIDSEALDCYLTMGFVPGERCILQGVRKLPPAHALIFDLVTARSRVWRYWVLPEPPPDAAAAADDEVQLLEELETLLADSVRRQLIADVPVGILLSGGVDSSLVAALAVRATSKVRTFTMRFPGHGSFDETEHARLIARHFGTEHLELETQDSAVDLLPMLARQFDEPMVDSSMIPTYLISRLTRQHCTVALGGDGGDELFGGYVHYNRLLKMQRTLGRLPQLVRGPLARAGGALLPLGFRGRNWLQSLGIDLKDGLPLIAQYFDTRARRQLMSRPGEWPLVGEVIRARNVPRTPDLLQRATRSDFENYLAEDILVKVDRASMLNSLEVRAPLLDYRVIEFAFGKVPSHLKATTEDRKILLKKLSARILPPQFDRHRKQGFSIPLASWLRQGSWWRFFRDVLLDSDGGFFDRRALGHVLEGQARGRSNAERLFALVMLELWRREYHPRLAPRVA
jgi:asparagine synthase (glutamine-hydrolysing)